MARRLPADGLPPGQEQAAVDAATADAAKRLRCKALASLSCKEGERLLDGNFQVNDEVWVQLRQAWDCAVRLDCQLGEADRPWEERNRWLQSLATERTSLEKDRAVLETENLCAKLEVQTAFATTGLFEAARLANVLEANLSWRGRCASLGEEVEQVVYSSRQALKLLGERPDSRTTEPASPCSGGNSMTKKWHSDYDTVRQENERFLRAIRHTDSAVAVPACTIEEVIDHNWRFTLELVGLFEKLIAQQGSLAPVSEGETGAAGASAASHLSTSPALEHAESTRAELEERLASMLECKLGVQAVAAQGQTQDVAAVEATVEATRKSQASAWRLLTESGVDLSNIVPTKFAEEMLPHPAAFGEAATAGEDGSEEQLFLPVLRMLTYNIFIRAPAPQITHNTDDDRKDERLMRFAEHLRNYDVICLQEIFGAFSNRRDWLIEVASRLGLCFEHRSPTGVRPRFLVDGGLLILSRLPIVSSSSLTFEPGAHMDRLSAKGALYGKLQCGPEGPYLHVCTTHLQSSYSEDSLEQSRLVRHAQLEQLVAWLSEKTSGDVAGGAPGDASGRAGAKRRWPLLLCGTLNFNARRSPGDGSSSAEYCAVRELLRSSLGEVRDLLFDTQGSHPVTYADTKPSPSGEEAPAERVLTNAGVYGTEALKRQCLDYMFFFPQQPAGEPEAVVPATCQLQKFLVDRTRDVGAPVTQLSDHYGVEAAMAVIPAMGAAPQRPQQQSAVAVEADACEETAAAMGEPREHRQQQSAVAVETDACEKTAEPGEERKQQLAVSMEADACKETAAATGEPVEYRQQQQQRSAVAVETDAREVTADQQPSALAPEVDVSEEVIAPG